MTEKQKPRFLVEMTSEEVTAAMAGGADTVVFACGSIEQHGPHLPLLVDSLLGEALSERIGARLDGVLVGPTLRLGCSEHHMAFAGSLTLREETFKAVLHDYCTSLGRHGFQRVFIVPSHGGNFRPVREFVEGWEDGPDRPHLSAYTDLLRFVDIWREVVAEMGGPVDHVGGHADIAESSVVLAVRPDLVRAEEARAGYTGDLEAALPVIWERGFAAVTDNGVLGDPEGMSPELGHRLLDRLADEVASHLRGGD